MSWWLLGALTFGVWGLFVAFAWERRAVKPKDPVQDQVGVTVFKPLIGLVPGLRENLEAFCGQTHPTLQIILGAEDSTDPALEVARAVQRAHPECNILVLAGTPRSALNPKVSNLLHFERFARHPFVLISDADVRPHPEYVSNMLRVMKDPTVGLVHSPLICRADDSDASLLESLHFNTWVNLAVIGCGRLVDQPIVVGKSMLLRRTALQDIGGLQAFADVLAEDYLIGQTLASTGWRVRDAGEGVAVHMECRRMAQFRERISRWAQMRFRINPFAYLCEVLLNPSIWCLTTLIAGLLKQEGWMVIGVVGLLVKWHVERRLFSRWSGMELGLSDIPMLLVKDLAVTIAWLRGPFVSQVNWSGNRRRVTWGSRLKTVEKPKPAAVRIAR